ncbi:MAG: hypothetical protein WCH44_13590, partial [Betaproteobacteria bacterium]
LPVRAITGAGINLPAQIATGTHQGVLTLAAAASIRYDATPTLRKSVYVIATGASLRSSQ